MTGVLVREVMSRHGPAPLARLAESSGGHSSEATKKIKRVSRVSSNEEGRRD